MRRLVGIMVAALLMAACGGPLRSGKAAFRSGHYTAAKEDLQAAGRHSAQWDTECRAEHALYLGLTYAELGDVTAARMWLAAAAALEVGQPGLLERQDWILLQLGLKAVEAPTNLDAATDANEP